MKLKKSVLRKSNIVECDFIDSDLSECNFTYSALSGTLFNNSNLTKANFSYATDYDINPMENILKKAIFTIPDATALLKCFDIVIK